MRWPRPWPRREGPWSAVVMPLPYTIKVRRNQTLIIASWGEYSEGGLGGDAVCTHYQQLIPFLFFRTATVLFWALASRLFMEPLDIVECWVAPAVWYFVSRWWRCDPSSSLSLPRASHTYKNLALRNSFIPNRTALVRISNLPSHWTARMPTTHIFPSHSLHTLHTSLASTLHAKPCSPHLPLPATPTPRMSALIDSSKPNYTYNYFQWHVFTF